MTGAEELAADWAAANGITTTAGVTVTGSFARPSIEELPMPAGEPPVTRIAWSRPGCHPATLYRIEGGGHGWPGGPQYLPSRAIGPVARHLDATGLLLDMAARQTAVASGRTVSGLERWETA